MSPFSCRKFLYSVQALLKMSLPYENQQRQLSLGSDQEAREFLQERDNSSGMCAVNILSALQKKLTCPVCYVQIQGSINCCPNGHVTCELCLRDICSICRAEMGQDGSSQLIRQIVEMIPHRCSNNMFGCEEEHLLQYLPFHQSECVSRMVRCPRYSCRKEMTFNDLLLDHCQQCVMGSEFLSLPFASLYTFSSLIDSDGSGVIGWIPDGLSFDGERFIFRVAYHEMFKKWYFSVQILGGAWKSSQYKTEICVHKVGDESHLLRSVSDVCPIDIVFMEGRSVGYGLSLSDAEMGQVMAQVVSRQLDIVKYHFSVKINIMRNDGY